MIHASQSVHYSWLLNDTTELLSIAIIWLPHVILITCSESGTNCGARRVARLGAQNHKIWCFSDWSFLRARAATTKIFLFLVSQLPMPLPSIRYCKTFDATRLDSTMLYDCLGLPRNHPEIGDQFREALWISRPLQTSCGKHCPSVMLVVTV